MFTKEAQAKILDLISGTEQVWSWNYTLQLRIESFKNSFVQFFHTSLGSGLGIASEFESDSAVENMFWLDEYI